ncbi:carbonic anhydrase [Volucribacter psittacicida]|uniref:carbonic anhydrase n=1 Tax=Volucribacter psittacicida TaxID=203482 RepID=A0A4R1FUU6_9PAST|nr:carbonic anhydrase family protein [Volucribacter psittacicida]TCJ98593.1 carbonic anhydrase [Volucribacter psittacicida]
MMKNIGIISIFSAILLGCSQQHHHDQNANLHHHHWSYVGNEDPAHWGELATEYQVCKLGKNQSPVDVSESIETHSHTIKLHTAKTQVKLENNGHSIQATPITANNQLWIKQTPFALQQFHFHTPSEHTFKQKHFPLEAHFVYQNEEGQLAVIAVFFTLGKANSELAKLEQQTLPIGEKHSVTQEVDLAKLMPKNPKHFRLTGSLTTPPCTEGVNWIIMQQPIEASQSQIDWLANVMGKNNRPLQPLNSRFIIQE